MLDNQTNAQGHPQPPPVLEGTRSLDEMMAYLQRLASLTERKYIISSYPAANTQPTERA